METLPFMQFDVDAFLSSSSVSFLSDAEQGQYFRFLCHSWKQGGKLWKRKGEGIPTMKEIAFLLRIKEEEAKNLLDNLIDKGCVLQDDTGVYYNKRCFEDRQKIEKKVSAGRLGGLKSRPPEKTLQNLRNVAEKRSKTEAPSEASSEASSEAPSEAKWKHPRNKLELELELESDINTSLSTAHARTNGDRSGDVETSGYTIEPPPGMPKNEDEAVAMAELAGVPSEFTKGKAYPKILSIGFREGNTIIRHFGQWAKLYYSNWINSEKRREVVGAKSTANAVKRTDSYLFNDKKVKEL